VRYGAKDDRYLDWSITVNSRIGGLSEQKQSGGPLERQKLITIDVSDSAIRRHVYDPDQPNQPPRITRVRELQAVDYDAVNYEYQKQLNEMSVGWQEMHPEIVANHDRHNTAFLGFMAKDRDVEFREGEDFGWVRNTVVCIDSDLADAVVTDRAYHYFPTLTSTAAVSVADGPDERLKFMIIGAGHKPTAQEKASTDANEGLMQAKGSLTMGMLIEAIYAGDWTDEVDDLLAGGE